MKKNVIRLIVVAACLVPAIGTFLLNFVAEPARISPSLSSAYAQIGAGPITSALIFTLIGMVQIAALTWLVLWRVGSESIWRWERPYSLWSTVKWSLLLAVATIVVMRFAAFAILTKIGRLVPSYYDEPSSDLLLSWHPWKTMVEVGFSLCLLMFLASAVIVVVLKLGEARRQRRA